MQGLIHPEETSTFDKKLKFNAPADYREQFMNWHTAQKITKGVENYYLGDAMHIRSVLINYKSSEPLKKFDNTWLRNKKAGLYYLFSKNSIRNKESVISDFSYFDHPNNGKSWKTSGNERNGNQPITQRMKSTNNHVKSRLAVDYEYDSFPIGHPENPFTNAFVIDFYGEIQNDPIKTAAGTLRSRVSYEDYIKYINGVKNKMLDLKKDYDFLSHSQVLPDMPVTEFARLFNSHSQVNYYGTRAMKRMKGCWADTFIEFNNLGTLLRFQIEFLGTDEKIYKKVKQNDNEGGFNPEKMPTLYVCDSPTEKVKFLEDHKNIGFNSPILTKAEYFTLMKAWWYAYAEMTNNGQDRSTFSFQSFITQLHAKADDWHIDAFTAQMVMGSFGYGVNEQNLGIRFSGNPAEELGTFKWKSENKKNPKYDFNYEAQSSDIALDFTTFLYLSGDPEMLSYIRFHLWKPEWGTT
ncbi:hypothetical protein DSAG12_01602 [Promethearchaeum syntrophicum]|uniref:Uncharacterized protein n=1 Tax=Promethearchaeum syntrophicum TaxID=2594042 RepID=A0A5B9DA12_9ARCH|nr:hypothetical protein [Candidatus Prometheoarchaeum syntrophicum]QEE15775.1 hypothetical protein DSAG12_01602 [Candidatus Prometheoarchaeum syntrophicum]